MEERKAPSGGGFRLHDAVNAKPVHPHIATKFMAIMTPSGVLVPLDKTSPTPGKQKPIAPPPIPASVVVPTGSTGLQVTPQSPTDPPDPASGKVLFTLSRDGKQLNVVAKLSHIANVSAVTLHDLNYAGSSYTDTTSGQAVVTIANYPSQLGQTVGVLLAPGPGSGPVGNGVFNTVIKTGYLIGPLAGRPLTALLRDMQNQKVYVNVQTNNQIDPTAMPAGPGNFSFGEIRGLVQPMK